MDEGIGPCWPTWRQIIAQGRQRFSEDVKEWVGQRVSVLLSERVVESVSKYVDE